MGTFLAIDPKNTRHATRESYYTQIYAHDFLIILRGFSVETLLKLVPVVVKKCTISAQ